MARPRRARLLSTALLSVWLLAGAGCSDPPSDPLSLIWSPNGYVESPEIWPCIQAENGKRRAEPGRGPLAKDEWVCREAFDDTAYSITLHDEPMGRVTHEITLPGSPHHVEIHERFFVSPGQLLVEEEGPRSWTKIELETGEKGWTSERAIHYPKIEDFF